MYKIEQILQETIAKKWPFPKAFEALKEAGVTSYSVTLSPFHAVFEGTFGKWEHGKLENYQSMNVPKEFSSAAVKQAIANHTKGMTNYESFLEEISKAGVSHYKVTMDSRTICYSNRDNTDHYEELIPRP